MKNTVIASNSSWFCSICSRMVFSACSGLWVRMASAIARCPTIVSERSMFPLKDPNKLTEYVMIGISLGSPYWILCSKPELLPIMFRLPIFISTNLNSHPGSGHLDTLVNAAVEGIAEAGRHGARYFTTDMCDGESQHKKKQMLQ